uniref:Uncharacterized protein n=1 Tax=Ananas comosus var. bracteatus TaxID=296719 RepID=A0A6V7P9P3_ANACO|nr:unnamed protein product [Ananas comosus var. bracteatus]
MQEVIKSIRSAANWPEGDRRRSVSSVCQGCCLPTLNSGDAPIPTLAVGEVVLPIYLLDFLPPCLDVRSVRSPGSLADSSEQDVLLPGSRPLACSSKPLNGLEKGMEALGSVSKGVGGLAPPRALDVVNPASWTAPPRFEEVWLSRDDFCILVPIWRSEVRPKSKSVLTFVAKLRHCRNRIKEWCSTHFYNITKTKELSDEIQKLDILEESENLTALQRDSRKQLKSKLYSVLADEEVLWKSRARQQWLKEGDGNTKFFHAVANGRR